MGIEATSDKKEKEVQEQELKHKMFLRFLQDAFVEADDDGNGYLDKEEFESLIGKPEVHRHMRELGIHLTQDELLKAWSMLDIDGNGELNIEEFVTGLSYLQEGLATKHILNVDYSLKRVAVNCENRMQKMASLVAQVVGQNEEILRHLENGQDSQSNVNIGLWQHWALQHEFGNICRQQMRTMSTGENSPSRTTAT